MATIEKNVPIPPQKRGGLPLQYRYKDMSVGDSILNPNYPSGSMKQNAEKKCKGWKFTTRAEYDKQGNIIGTRIWRIK